MDVHVQTRLDALQTQERSLQQRLTLGRACVHGKADNQEVLVLTNLLAKLRQKIGAISAKIDVFEKQDAVMDSGMDSIDNSAGNALDDPWANVANVHAHAHAREGASATQPAFG